MPVGARLALSSTDRPVSRLAQVDPRAFMKPDQAAAQFTALVIVANTFHHVSKLKHPG